MLFSVAVILFLEEGISDFLHALDPDTGRALTLDRLQLTPAMVRSASSAFSRAYINLLALLLTFISLANRSPPTCIRPS